MDTTKMWDYRVVRKESKDGSDEWYSVQEVYYDDETGEPMAQTIDLMIEGDTITGMRTQLQLMLKSLEEPVLDESDILESKEESHLYEQLEHEGNIAYRNKETGEMRNMFGDKIGEDGRGNNLYIYESPDGGETIFRRKMSEDKREELKAKKSWVCQICGKNTYDVDWDYIGSGTNHLGCELEAEMGGKTLHEDMGDGHLIKVSKKVKENLKSLRTGKKPTTERGL